MKKGIKYALLFTGGAVVGFGVCIGILKGALKQYRNDRKKYPENTEKPDYDVIFDCHTDAEQAIDSLEKIIERYGFASVVDMYDLADLPSPSFKDNQYGWNNTNGFDIKRCRHGYKLIFPAPELIK